jgi:ABC-type multidrug transport system fused ATPase/permease subunit
MAAAAQIPVSHGIDPRAAALYSNEARSLSAREAWRILVRTWPFIRAHRRLLAIKCALAFGSLLFFLLTPWPLKIVIDNVIDSHPLAGPTSWVLLPLVGDNRALLLAVVAGFLAVAAIAIGMVGDHAEGLDTGVASGGLDQAGFTANDANSGWSLWNGFFGMLEVWVTLDLTQRLNQTLRTTIYERFLRAPIRLHADQKIGDAIFRVMHDSAAIGAILYRGILAPLMSIVMFTLTIVVLALQFPDQPAIVILNAVALPIVAVVSALFGRALRNQSQQMRERGSDVMAAFEERVAQVHLIKAFGQEQRERDAVDRASWGSFSASLKMLAVILVVILALAPAILAIIWGALYALMMQVIRGRLTLGDVALLAGYGLLLLRPMAILGSTWATIQVPLAGIRRMFSVLDLISESEPDGNGRAFVEPIREIALRDVTLAYDPSSPVLSGVTLTLRRGEISAIAGHNGLGKSTLISAIPRFIEPIRGAVMIDGIDARELAPAQIRRRVGFVFQHEALFSTSIRNNIRYGHPSANDDEVRRAAAMAGVASFVESLPDGYETVLGRRGTRLSVGQKQRIAIARALIRNPEVLILDEPTAPLDPASEGDLMRTLRGLARDRIVLLVAHRPETLAECDIVHFLSAGTLAASGTHLELLETSALYRQYLAASRSADRA